jgi:TRAP-type C4-dicarboxylate transport system permease small subunit
LADEQSNTLLARGLRTLHAIEDGALVVVLLTMVLLAFGQIVLRNLFDIGFIWIDPLLRTMVLWVGMLGALVATRQGKQISVDVLTRILTPRLCLISKVVTLGFAALVCGIIAWHSTLFIIDEWTYKSIAFASVPAWIPESIIPVGFAIMTVRFMIQSISAVVHLFRGTEQ